MPAPAKRPTRITGPWSSLRILNSSSPIITKDLHAFLVTCISGWNDSYSEAEKQAIIDSLPLAYRKSELDGHDRLICPVTIDFVLDDPYIKAAITKFKTDVSEGFYEKGWQNQAKSAMQERRDGKFDAHLKENMEATFGDEQVAGQDDSVAINNDNSVQVEAESDGEWVEKKRTGKSKVFAKSPVLRQKRKG